MNRHKRKQNLENQSPTKRNKLVDESTWICRPEFNGNNDNHSNNNEGQNLVFMLVEIDYYTDRLREPVIRLYGVDEQGHSVVAHIFGYRPYFYVEAPRGFAGDDDLRKFRTHLESRLQRAVPQWQKVEQIVTSTTIVYRQNIRGYDFGRKQQFIQIYVASPQNIPTARNILQADGLAVFEANVPFCLRFMIDLDIRGAGWIELISFKPRNRRYYASRCQIEVNTSFTEIISHNDVVPRYMQIAPLLILSFDIECKFFTQIAKKILLLISCDHSQQLQYLFAEFSFFDLLPQC